MAADEWEPSEALVAALERNGWIVDRRILIAVRDLLIAEAYPELIAEVEKLRGESQFYQNRFNDGVAAIRPQIEAAERGRVLGMLEEGGFIQAADHIRALTSYVRALKDSKP